MFNINYQYQKATFKEYNNDNNYETIVNIPIYSNPFSTTYFVLSSMIYRLIF